MGTIFETLAKNYLKSFFLYDNIHLIILLNIRYQKIENINLLKLY